LLTLSNTGNVSLDYQINHDIEWLTISPENGAIPAFNTELIQFNVSTLFMNYGEYNGTIEIETSVGAFYVEVTIIVAGLNIDNDIAGIPHTFKVHNNFPNPFNPVTTFSIDLPAQSSVNAAVYDLYGRKIATLLHSVWNAGSYNLSWQGQNDAGAMVSAGMYFLKVDTEYNHHVQKMIFLK
jgi:hypothetical protein